MKRLINKLKIPVFAGISSLILSNKVISQDAFALSEIGVVKGSGTEYVIPREKAEKELHKLAKNKLSPPSGDDFNIDETLMNYLCLEDEKIISKEFDGFGVWEYSSNNKIKSFAELSEKERLKRRNEIVRIILAAKDKSFKKNKFKEKNINKFYRLIKPHGFYVNYKELPSDY